MEYAVYNTPLGYLKIGYEDDRIVLMDKALDNKEYGVKTNLTDIAYNQIIEYINGKRRVFDFPYKLNGTIFQIKVWKALCEIPYGETRTYKDIAIAIGNPKASRAVGMANNKNPIIIVVPCHRVIGSDGKLVGYAGGLDMKRQLLDIEQRNLKL